MVAALDRALHRATGAGTAIGGLAGAAALPPLLALLIVERVAPAGDRPFRVALLGGTTLALGLAVLAIIMGTAACLRRLGAPAGSRAALRRAVQAWWPALAFVPVLASVPFGGDAAHRFLRAPDEGRIFTLYAGFWLLMTHLGLLAGSFLLRRVREAAARPLQPEGPASGAAAGWPEPYALHGLAAALAMAVTLAALFNWGIIQQLTARQGEFESHFAAARAMLRGVMPYRLDLDIWAQINVPPITLALVYAPWIVLPDLPRHLVYGILHTGAFATAFALLLRRLLSPAMPALTVALAIVLVGSIYAPWRESFWLGQPNGFIFLTLTLALLALLRQRWFAAGALAATSLIFKPVGGWVLLYLLIARRYPALVGAAIAGLALLAVSIPIAGLGVWQAWIVEKAPLLLRGTTHHTSISLPVLHARLFLTSNAYYLSVPPPGSSLVTILNGVAVLTALLLLLALVRPQRDARDRSGRVLEFSLATVVALMLSPLTWLHYATAALIAFVALLDVGRTPAIPSVFKRVVAGLGMLAFAILSIDQELFLIRTAAWWEAWPLLGSISNAGLPLLAAAVAILLWAYDRFAVTPEHEPRETWIAAETVPQCQVDGSPAGSRQVASAARE